MASVVDTCNTALSHVGARAQISSISPPDGSVEAGYCARFYPIARREMIEAHSWGFSKTRITLAEVTNPSTIWTYAYALPADCLKPIRVLALTTANVLWPQSLWVDNTLTSVVDENEGREFDIENGVILTHEPEAVLLYRRDVTDTAKFPPLFGSALSMLLASYLAGAIVKGEVGIKMGDALRSRAFGMLGKAAASDANASTEHVYHTPDHIRVRA